MRRFFAPATLSLLALLPCSGLAREEALSIDAAHPAAKVSPMLYGLMTEEINHCYDGGLYAELVRNRAFLDDSGKPVHWSPIAGSGAAPTLALDPSQPLNAAIPTSLRVEVTEASAGKPAGVANAGYWGFPIKPATTYKARLHAKAAAGFTGPITLSLQSEDGTTTYATAQISGVTQDWQYLEATLTTTADVSATQQARFALTAQQPGTLWLSLVSLFPPTWKDRPNGLRPDLMQMLVDLKPAFLRFPGGNYLEGETIETRFDWKKTLGPITGRTGHPGTWGYRSSDGMGLMEFLLWCEDMNAEPVLGLYAGYSLQGAFIKPGKDLEPYVQDALDEIEYVTGPVTTKWGAQRAKDGHPAPFKLRYVEIGNEDFFDKSGSYDGRFSQFRDAIKKQHPDLKCISTIGNEQAKNLHVHSRKPDVLDEHYYRPADAFLKDAPNFFERYDRKGPEIFVGEWAAHETAFPPWNEKSKNEAPTPTMKAALGDAAWMAAMERNSDIVTMHCYAPLFANVNGYQWRPDLIGYDALHAFGSPSYYALRMFSTHVGDEILKARFDKDSSLQGSVTRDAKTGMIYVKLVNPLPAAQPLDISITGLSSISPTAEVETLSAAPDATNSITDRTRVIPVKSTLTGIKTKFTHTVEPTSVTVIKLSSR
jgi:alpha-L-arabinofuranosidase